MDSKFLDSLSAHSVAAFIKDQAKYLAINRAGANMLDHPMEKIIGTSDHDLFDAPSAKLMVERDTGLIKSSSMTFVSSVVRVGDRWLRFYTAKMGYEPVPSRRLLIGLSILVEGARDVEDEAFIRQAAARVEADPARFLELIFNGHPDFVSSHLS